jgi:hypothetical protein
MYVYHATTTTNAPALTAITPGVKMPELFGVIATYAESATFYIKFWWGGNTNTVPTLGVTEPNLTVPISSGGPGFVLTKSICMQGPLYWAATANASDTDATALGTGGDVINILLG